jgi:hypothetical protein
MNIVERIQPLSQIPDGIISCENAKESALRLCAAICDYLATALIRLTQSRRRDSLLRHN